MEFVSPSFSTTEKEKISAKIETESADIIKDIELINCQLPVPSHTERGWGEAYNNEQ